MKVEWQFFTKRRREVKAMNEVNELINLLFEQKGKLIWIISQSPSDEEQREAIEEARDLLDRVNNLLEEFGYGVPS